ncbi:MAG TPA: class I SAM-dependent methyltransferase [Vicinamibacterales bacterium]|nr:class I SAM-dependent methyltransferase [Vicinamibacterales bacterium]
MFTRYVNPALSALTIGREDQSFLDARWIAVLLRNAPSRSRRRLALWVLSLSPHYFYRRPEYEGLSHAEFTEREFERNRATREKLGELVLGPHVNRQQVVLDYGCGPGFLVHYVAGLAKTVYGVDISHGVLECARVINGVPNALFLHTANMAEIGNATVDLVYSVAVAQHLTDSVLERVFDTLRQKLRPAGRLLFHIVLDAEGWRTEEEWRRDVSLAGQVRLKYGLNCFTRSEKRVRAMLKAAGFGSIVVRPMREMCPEPFDDVCAQHLVCAEPDR